MVGLFGVVLAAVILWQYSALAYQWHYRACLLRRADHYPNIVSLRNAPDRPTYNTQSKLQCEAEESDRRFETAETDNARNKWGQKAIIAYTALIEAHHFDSYRSDRAAVYASLGQYEPSLADYDYLLTNDPDNYWMYENRANLFLQMGQPTQARQDYQTLYIHALTDSSNPQAYLDQIEGVIGELERMVD
jgi:tetratricopeptide (TPR) repeat protein